MAKTCGLCGYAAMDDSDFDGHMQTQHQWSQAVHRDSAISDGAIIAIVVVMTPLLLVPTVAGGVVRAVGVLSFLVMFALVLRARGPRVLLRALGAIAILYSVVFVFGVILALLLGG